MRAGREGFRTPPEMGSPDDLELAPLLRGGPPSPSRSELPETRCEENIGNVSGNDDALCLHASEIRVDVAGPLGRSGTTFKASPPWWRRGAS